jgi:hypothetical protein
VGRTEGSDCKALGVWTGEGEKKTGELLRFLLKIDAVEAFQRDNERGLKIRWRLTERLQRLYGEVMRSN